ncbi:hypothetical protein [Streptomyces sp. NPDC002104]
MRRLATSTAVLAVFALAGCTASESPQRTAGAPSANGTARPSVSASASAAAAAARTYTFRLPIGAYSFTAEEYSTIEAAEQVLAKRCMSRYSLAYEPPAPERAPVSADRRYGLSDASEALSFGYRMPPAPAETKGKQLGKDEIFVLYGRRGSEGKLGPLEYRGTPVPEDGCLGQSIQDFRKGYEDPESVNVARGISMQSYTDSLALPEVQALFRTWSACMKEKGYTYASPMDPLGVKDFQDGPVRPEEKATAQADMACKQKTNLLDSWFTAESGIQTALIAKDTGALGKLRELHQKKLAAARSLVAEG